jgi:EmrB/QacA subfamily drug resistance transporter
LIAFRGLQALGAAMLSANSPAILTKSFPDHQRGQALGMQATMTYLGLTVGPSLGGWLTEQISWRAVFFINLPVGLLAFLLSWRFVPHDGGSQTKEHFDLAGALSFMAGLIALLLGLNQGSAWGWRSLPISSLLVAAMILLIVFVRIELKAKNPMLDLTLFRHRVFSASVVSAVFNYICVYSILFLMPFYLIQGRQLNAAQAGLVLTAMPIVMAVVAPLSGYLSDRIGARIPSTLGMLCLAGGLFMLSRLDPGSSTLEMIEALGISGLGIGTFISPNNSALMGSAPRRRQGIAAGMMATARNVGMVLGVGLAGAVYTTVLAQHAQSAATSLFEAVQASFLTAIVVAVLGAIASSIGGQRAKASEPLEPQHT